MILLLKRFGDKYTYSTIKSIEINHVKYEQYKLQENTDIGIMLDKSNVESYISGLISADAALARLKHFKPNNQLCITSQQLIDDHLAFVESLTLETE